MSGSCKVCGKPKGRNKYYCSRACWAEDKQNYKTCIVCGKLFANSPSNRTVCCSQECSRRHRGQISSTADNLKDARKAAAEMPKMQKGEQHINAKSWVIQAPDGRMYTCRNLMHWCRENEDLFDGTARQAWNGFAKQKETMRGTIKRGKSYQWKGWRLIDWGEE